MPKTDTQGSRPSEPVAGHHHRMLSKESAIASEVIRERGYYTIHRPKSAPECFSRHQRRAGLVIPLYSPDGESTSYQLRPDNPPKGKKGKVAKYLNPAGRRTILDVHPCMRDRLTNPNVPLWITEGIRKGDALTSLGRCTVALVGVWNFNSATCWQHVALEGRTVFIVYDSDVMVKTEVHQALAQLVAFLKARGARPLVIYLPAGKDNDKVGVDDYLAAGGSVEYLEEIACPLEIETFTSKRLSRNRGLAHALVDLWHAQDEMPVKTMGQNTNRAVMRTLIWEAEKSGALTADGVAVAPGTRAIALGSEVSYRSAQKAIKRLEASGYIRVGIKESEKNAAAVITLLTGGRALGNQYGRRQAKEGKQRGHLQCISSYGDYLTRTTENADTYQGNSAFCPRGDYPARGPESLPELRWSTTLIRREKDKHGRTEIVREPLARLGKKRAAIIEYLVDCGGEASVAELMVVFAGERTRPRDFKRRTLAPLFDPAIIAVDDDHVCLVENWRLSLEVAREIGKEFEAHILDRERYRRQRTSYRNRDKVVPNPTPEPPGMDDLSQPWPKHPERCACRPCSERFGSIVGEHVVDCRCKACVRVRRTGGVSNPAPPPAFREEAATPGPVIRDTPDERLSHSLGCDCLDCVIPEPKYARPFRRSA